MKGKETGIRGAASLSAPHPPRIMLKVDSNHRSPHKHEANLEVQIRKLTLALARSEAREAQIRDSLLCETAERRRTEEMLHIAMGRIKSITWKGTVRSNPDANDASGNTHLWDMQFDHEDVIKIWLPIDMRHGETFGGAWARSVVFSDRPAMNKRSDDALLNNQSGYSQEYRITLADGQVMWFHEEVCLDLQEPGFWNCTGVCTDITPRKRGEEQAEIAEAHARLEQLALHDGLTGLKNHRAFHERLNQEYKRALLYHTPLSLIMLDVDHFKNYNDTHGHPAGDIVLQMVAKLLQDNVRPIDYAARYGGEEFVVIVPAERECAIEVAKRFQTAFEETEWPRRQITASFGVTTFISAAAHPNTSALLAEADAALYVSKSNGRNRLTHAREFTETNTGAIQDLSINAGGEDLEGSAFVADIFHHGGTAHALDGFIDTAGVASAAPADVYRSERRGDFTYRVTNLSFGGLYLVRLHFAEREREDAGAHSFDVAINGISELTSFDIFAAGGGPCRAVVREFTTIANETGGIEIVFRGADGAAAVSGIEIVPLTYKYNLSLNCGGGAVWPFTEDRFFTGGEDLLQVSGSNISSLDMSEVDTVIPVAVYQSERCGAFTYAIPGLPPGARCLVSLHFCEFFWNSSGYRVFNVAINGIPALCHFDILAETGAPLKPIVKKFVATANEEGTVALDFVTISNQAQIAAIEIHW